MGSAPAGVLSSQPAPAACPFGWYVLRSTDPAGSAAFYGSLLGFRSQPSAAAVGSDEATDLELWDGSTRIGAIGLLPPRARAMGAPSHWLGQVAVVDLDAALATCMAAGATVLGPLMATGTGRVAVLRDPQGAVLALRTGGPWADRGGVVRHELQTTDVAAAVGFYRELLGLEPLPLRTRGELSYVPFRFRDGRAPTDGAACDSHGGIVDSARAAHIHPHWLPHFGCDDLEQAAIRVRALGGTIAYGPGPAPSGGRVLICDDPQGAAFALYDARPAAVSGV